MHTCNHIDSCALVSALQADFPKALALLREKYCSSDSSLCSIFQNGGINEGESLIYQNIAWVKTLIESEINGLTKAITS